MISKSIFSTKIFLVLRIVDLFTCDQNLQTQLSQNYIYQSFLGFYCKAPIFVQIYNILDFLYQGVFQNDQVNYYKLEQIMII